MTRAENELRKIGKAAIELKSDDGRCVAPSCMTKVPHQMLMCKRHWFSPEYYLAVGKAIGELS
jgi:hypothetical protein